MKVLHVYRTCYPETNGGVEQVIRSISEGCQKQKISSKVLTLSEQSKSPYILNDVEIIPVKKNIEIASNGFSIELLRVFKKLSQWADIVHFHYPWPSGDLLSLMTNKPIVVTYHSDIVRQKLLKILYKPLETFFLKRANLIVATSPQYVESSYNLRKFRHKTEIIPLAIDENNYRQPTQDRLDFWRNKVGKDFFLFVGVLRYYKGLTYLLKAAAKINQTIIIAGDGPLREELILEAKSLRLKNVRFLGFISEDDKTALLSLSKAFIFPSHLRSEAFGMSLLEAQLFSKPLITCDVGTGSSYVNQNERTGLIVEPANADALANAIQKIAENSELQKSFGDESHNRYKQLFTNEVQCNKYAKIYGNIVEKYSNRRSST